MPASYRIKDGRFIGIEVKRKDGRLSPEQVSFGNELQKAGGTYLVARSIEEAQRVGL